MDCSGLGRRNADGSDHELLEVGSTTKPQHQNVTSSASEMVCWRHSKAGTTESGGGCKATGTGGEACVGANLSRRLLFVSLARFDLDGVHPPSPPYLGYAYWVTLAPSPPPSTEENDDGSQSLRHFPPLLPDRSLINRDQSEGANSVPSVDSTVNSVPSSDDESDNEEPFHFSVAAAIGDDGGDNEGENDRLTVDVTPRRLFVDRTATVTLTGAGERTGHDRPAPDEDSCRPIALAEGEIPANQATPKAEENSPSRDSKGSDHAMTFARHCSYGPICADATNIRTTSNPFEEKVEASPIIHNGVLIRGTVRTPSNSRSIATSTSETKRKQRLISTLPSFEHGKPIRLRVIESYSCSSTTGTADPSGVSSTSWGSGTASYLDHFSYDPFVSMGTYDIHTLNGSPYGNGLSVQMGDANMTLQDQDGRIVALTRSRHTFVPSHIIYGPEPRFEGQRPSSLRPMLECGGSQGSGGQHFRYQLDETGRRGTEAGTVSLYPWAIVKKEGRRMDHDVTVHFVDDGSNRENNPGGRATQFQIQPALRSRHGFDSRGVHTHTVVSRVTATCDTAEKEVPCCLIIRDPFNHDVFNITIAPGIDPVLVLCYVAVHAKMDVEPKLSAY